jgi:hypothetical protein
MITKPFHQDYEREHHIAFVYLSNYNLGKSYIQRIMLRIDVFVMNLPRHTERLANFKKQYQGTCHVVEAIDGKEEWDSEVMRNWPNMNHSSTASNYKGLQLSMRKSIVTAKELGSDWAVVCEDDGEFPKTVDFEAIIKQFVTSQVIWLDARNKEGNGYLPYSRMNAVMYHKSVFDHMIKELHPDTSTEMTHWTTYHKTQAMVNDYYIPWMLSRSEFRISSKKVVRSNVQTRKFSSSLRSDENSWKRKYDGTLDETPITFDGSYNVFAKPAKK